MKSFHEWKQEQVKKDGFTRSKEWYYKAYGGYCNKVRRNTTAPDVDPDYNGFGDYHWDPEHQ